MPPAQIDVKYFVMASSKYVQCLLWDFGDTLCDELSLWRVSPEWMEVYRSFNDEDGIGAAWSLGDLDTHEVVAKLAQRMTLNEVKIHAHLSRTDLFEFFPFTYAFFRARHLPQAVVTVNPAAFREMAQNLGFDEVTHTIVVSGEEKTIDKGVLCEFAIQRMPIVCANEQALSDRQQEIQSGRLGWTKWCRVSLHDGFCVSTGRSRWYR